MTTAGHYTRLAAEQQLAYCQIFIYPLKTRWKLTLTAPRVAGQDPLHIFSFFPCHTSRTSVQCTLRTPFRAGFNAP